MGRIHSVNLGTASPSRHADLGVTGIGKSPVPGPVAVRDPGPSGGGGLAGDAVCDLRHHGGSDQAVYCYALEDLRNWAAELGTPIEPGTFGENLTAIGVNVNGALVGEHWRIGDTLLLEVTRPRIPCRTFAGWLGVQGWVKTFTERAVPGAYLRVLEAGQVRAGDPLTVVHTPEHDVTVELVFRALTTERELLPRLLAADALPAELRDKALAPS